MSGRRRIFAKAAAATHNGGTSAPTKAPITLICNPALARMTPLKACQSAVTRAAATLWLTTLCDQLLSRLNPLLLARTPVTCAWCPRGTSSRL
jgi:hypothetical protein